MSIEFTEGQRRTIANALTVLALAVVISFIAVIIWGIFSVVAYTASAIVPVVMGFFLSLFFKPYFSWWKRIIKNETLALVVMLSTVFVPIGLLLWYSGSIIVDQVTNLVNIGPDMVAHVRGWFHENFPKLQALLEQLDIPYDRIGELYTNYSGAAVKAGKGALNMGPSGALTMGTNAIKILANILSALVTLLFFVFFLTSKERKGSEVVSEIPFVSPETRKFIGEQIDVFFGILVSFFQRQTIICLIEGCLYGAGFFAVGLPYGFLIGFALGVLNLIPLFGTVVCLPVALPLAYFGHDGSQLRLILVLVVWMIGQGLDGYLITPRIQGDKTGLGYAGVIFSFFFWAIVFGPVLGMLLAIPLSAFCVVLWNTIKGRLGSLDIWSPKS